MYLPYSIHQQFVIGYDNDFLPPDWRREHFDGVSICVAPHLPLICLYDDNNVKIGIVLGWIMMNGRLHGDGDELRVPLTPDSALTWINDACGRFVVLMQFRSSLWFFTDAAASLAAVVSPRHRMIASTTNLIPTTEGCVDNNELTSLIEVKNTDRFYPFGLTKRHNVSRVLPNHAVNLSDFSICRVWPLDSLTPYSENEENAIKTTVGEICLALQHNVIAILDKENVYIQLSGGQDTRMVLAAARPRLERAKFYTLRTIEKNLQLDCILAAELASRFKLHHEIVDLVDPESDDVERWLAQSGECVGGRVSKMATTVKRLVGHDYWISGQFGEVGRGFYWRPSDLQRSEMSAMDLLQRAEIPISEQTIRSATTWLQGLPKGPAPWILDMMYIEHRMGCGMGPAYYGSLVPRVNLSPFNQRSIFHSMLQLPVVYRFNQRMYRDIVNRMWPELLNLPINRGFGRHRITYWEMEVKSVKKYIPESIMGLAKRMFWMLNRRI